MKKKIIIYLIPIILLILFKISKLILNLYNLEFMSWIYFAILHIFTAYYLLVTIYFIIKSNYEKIDKIMYILGFTVSLFILYMFALLGLNIIIDDERQSDNEANVVIQYEWLDQNCYEYKNIFVRGKQKILSIDCN